MSVRVAVRLGFFIFLAVARVGAQVDKTLSEREEVTAVDVVVELSTKGEPVKEISGDFSPGDFVIEEDGVPLAIVGVEKKETAEPWHVLLYFDLDLSSTLTMRRAASALADHAAELVGL
ncbi:MAG: hypothetical protein OEM62_10595, partial [Acidobacteriota bacterium]|nr:hypothetical protein [Acidobacteriota bacterium]